MCIFALGLALDARKAVWPASVTLCLPLNTLGARQCRLVALLLLSCTLRWRAERVSIRARYTVSAIWRAVDTSAYVVGRVSITRGLAIGCRRRIFIAADAACRALRQGDVNAGVVGGHHSHILAAAVLHPHTRHV